MNRWWAGFAPENGLRDGPWTARDGASSRAGIWVAGELGDAPLLRAALAEGWQVGQAASRDLRPDPTLDADLVIVGAGPAGVLAAAAARSAGLRVETLERSRTFATLRAFPADKWLYAEPKGAPDPDGWPFTDGAAGEVVAAWEAERVRRGIAVREGAEVTAIDGDSGRFSVRWTDASGAHTTTCARVVLAFGRRGWPARLAIPGGDRARDHLSDARPFAGAPVVVVGGGDSAVEGALSLAEAGADVTLVHRGARFDRPRPRNRARLQAALDGRRLRAETGTQLTALTPDKARLERPDATVELPAQAVFTLLGGSLPTAWLRGLGLRLRSDVRASEIAFALAFAAFTWVFYVLKSGRDLWPVAGPLAGARAALAAPIPGWQWLTGDERLFDAGLIGTIVYSLVILVFGVRAWIRYPSPEQRRRYASLISFQWVFLFGIPEVLAPLVTGASGAGWYSLSVPWPLRIDSLTHEPAAWRWALVGAFTSFVLIPLYVRYQNERFCSWMCGCGGLAETLGDLWRHRAPRGPLAVRAEAAGRAVLFAAIPLTLLTLNDAWQLVAWRQWLAQEVAADGQYTPAPIPDGDGWERLAAVTPIPGGLDLRVEKRQGGLWRPDGWIGRVDTPEGPIWPQKVDDGHYTLSYVGPGPIVVLAGSSPLSSAKDFARAWYGLMVDFLLASVVGVALYPVLGNRVWCRFFCPLRAYMELLSRRFGRLAITANSACISCGACTRACQMGIDVEGFARQELHFDNANSACIQCGICVEVCPVDVLTLVDKPTAGLPDGSRTAAGPRW